MIYKTSVEFKKLVEHIKMLKFEEKPDYKAMRTMFKDLFNREGYQLDNGFDWIVLNPIVILFYLMIERKMLQVK